VSLPLCLSELPMEADRAAEILRTLADGVDPFTGEVFDRLSPLQNPECVRALFAGVEALERAANSQGKRRKRDRSLPDRAGQSWDEREDEELTERFDAGCSVTDLAVHHQRTSGAIRARLVRLVKIQNRDEAK
jgi:hypothetical protein